MFACLYVLRSVDILNQDWFSRGKELFIQILIIIHAHYHKSSMYIILIIFQIYIFGIYNSLSTSC